MRIDSKTKKQTDLPPSILSRGDLHLLNGLVQHYLAVWRVPLGRRQLEEVLEFLKSDALQNASAPMFRANRGQKALVSELE